MAGYRVGVDVGGTFTDLICVTPSGEIVLDKTPSTLDDQSRGVMNGSSNWLINCSESITSLLSTFEKLTSLILRSYKLFWSGLIGRNSKSIS